MKNQATDKSTGRRVFSLARQIRALPRLQADRVASAGGEGDAAPDKL